MRRATLEQTQHTGYQHRPIMNFRPSRRLNQHLLTRSTQSWRLQRRRLTRPCNNSDAAYLPARSLRLFTCSGKAKAAQGDNHDNFRARRLSVSDIDTSEFEKGNPITSPMPQSGRQRRMSMRCVPAVAATAQPWPRLPSRVRCRLCPKARACRAPSARCGRRRRSLLARRHALLCAALWARWRLPSHRPSLSRHTYV